MVKRKTASPKAARDTVVDTAARAGKKTGSALRRAVAGAVAGAVSGALIGAASGIRKRSSGARSNTSTKRKTSRSAGPSSKGTRRKTAKKASRSGSKSRRGSICCSLANCWALATNAGRGPFKRSPALRSVDKIPLPRIHEPRRSVGNTSLVGEQPARTATRRTVLWTRGLGTYSPTCEEASRMTSQVQGTRGVGEAFSSSLSGDERQAQGSSRKKPGEGAGSRAQNPNRGGCA